MDTAVDSPDSLTAAAASTTMLATPPRRRKATRPTGPPGRAADPPDTEDPPDSETSSGTTDSGDPDVTKPRRFSAARIFRRQGLRRRVFRAAIAALAVVALAAAAVVAGLAFRDHQRARTADAHRAAVVDAARRGITALINISGDQADADFARLNDLTTAPFADELHSRSANYVQTVRDAKVRSTGQVVAAGPAEQDPGIPADGPDTVIVAADAQVTNTQTHQQEHRSYRFTVRVKQVGGVLKVSDVEFVP